MSTRVASFTLLELLIAMTLSVLVVGLCFQLIYFSKKQFTQLSAQAALSTEVNRLQLAILRDVDKAAFIQGQDNHLVLGAVHYEFQEQAIRWEEGYSDTFEIELARPFYMEKSTALVDQFEIAVNLYGEHLPLLFTKEYAAQTKMRYE